MSTPIASLGTSTTHGGLVTSASSITVNGRLAACVGDSVICPLHGPGVITDGGLGTIEGRPIAHHGSGTTCGATLIVTGGGPTV